MKQQIYNFIIRALCIALVLSLTACGGGGGSSASPTSTATPIPSGNAPPVIREGTSSSVSMSENGTPTAFSLTLHATDTNSDPLTWRILTPAANGTASVAGTGTSQVVNYVPNKNYIGSDSFVVQVSNSQGESATTTVNVAVNTTNTAVITVDAGPSSIATTSNAAYNRPYVSVTLCDPTSPSSCQTIDHIVVDTGAVGLHILSFAFTSLPYQNLPTVNDSTGTKPIGECYPLITGYLWGTLRTATVQIGGEVTTGPIPIEVIGDTTAGQVPSNPKQCSSTGTGTNIGSVPAIMANGILGVGYFKTDCGTACTSTPNKLYYTCTDPTDSTSCSAIAMPLANQVPNPVTQFGSNGSGVSDNNGVIISLPAVGLTGATNVSGTLTFGVNTQPDNQFNTNATVLTVDNPTGFLSTQFNGVNLCNSIIDSGSNNLNFPQGTMVFNTPNLCTANNTFYCPAANTYPSFSATMVGLNAEQVPVNFNVTDPYVLSGTAFNDVAAVSSPISASYPTGCPGSNPTTGSFIWGLPFFFGKNVTLVMSGETVDTYTGPFVAF